MPTDGKSFFGNLPTPPPPPRPRPQPLPRRMPRLLLATLRGLAGPDSDYLASLLEKTDVVSRDVSLEALAKVITSPNLPRDIYVSPRLRHAAQQRIVMSQMRHEIERVVGSSGSATAEDAAAKFSGISRRSQLIWLLRREIQPMALAALFAGPATEPMPVPIAHLHYLAVLVIEPKNSFDPNIQAAAQAWMDANADFVTTTARPPLPEAIMSNLRTVFDCGATSQPEE